MRANVGDTIGRAVVIGAVKAATHTSELVGN